jgi:hypothetical protein
MGSFKKLNKADITTFPYYANKKWELTATAGSSGSNSFLIFGGQNVAYNSIGDTYSNGQSYSLVYDSMNHMFYQSYTGLLNTGSLMFNVETLESASSQRPTSSYFNYNDSPYLIKNYPTGANEVIRVISIDKNIYGNKILPNSFNISSSGAVIRDDGYGNLYGSTDGTISGYFNLGYITVGYFVSQSLPAGIYHVGNIFYAHGLAIITTGSFSSNINIPLSNPLKISFQNEHIIYENEVRCIVRESDYNLTYNPTILEQGGEYITSGSSGYILTGSADYTVKNFATGSDFQPYVTSIGLYNDDNDLLMVAKLGKPIVLSSDTDMTFIVRYDT